MENKVMPIIEIKESAWNAMSGKWGYGAGVVTLFFLIYALLAVPGNLAKEGSLLAMILGILVLALTWGLSLGIAACFLDVASDAGCSYGRLFTAFRSVQYFFKVAVLEFLKSLFIALWSLLLIVPGIMKYYSFSMAELIVIDHPEYTPMQAISASEKMMYGHRMDLFRLQMAFALWFLLVMFTFGLASLWVLPYYNTAKSKFYLELKGE